MSTVEELLERAVAAEARPVGNGRSTTPPVEPKRDRWGRYLVPSVTDGKERPHTRATTVAKTLSDRFALERWQKRMVAIGLAKRTDLYARVAATTPDDKATLDKLTEEAQEAAEASVGRNLGSALHSFTERLDRGEDVKAPPPWDADLAAYRATLTAHRVEVVPDMIERVVVLAELGIAGTFDRLARVEGVSGVPLVTDLKTATNIFDWGEIALQLAIYAHAETIFDYRTGRHEPMPQVDQDRALVIHLPPGQATCTLHLVDIAAGWEALDHARWTREWRSRKDLATPLTVTGLEVPPAPPGRTGPNPDGSENPRFVAEPRFIAERAQTLRDRLRVAVEALGGTLPPGLAWPERVARFAEGGPRTWAGVELVDAFVREVEKAAEVPFDRVAPADPFESFGRDRCGAAPVDNVGRPPVIHTPPPRPIDDERTRGLKARVDALPEDLRAAAWAEAQALGIPGWPTDEAQLDAVTDIVGRACADHDKRNAFVVGRVQGFAGDELLALLQGVAEGRELSALRSDDVDRLDAVLDAMGRCVQLTYDTDGHARLEPLEGAEAFLVEHFEGSRAAALLACKELAAAHGRPTPRSAAAAAADPVLVAVATRVGTGEAV